MALLLRVVLQSAPSLLVVAVQRIFPGELAYDGVRSAAQFTF